MYRIKDWHKFQHFRDRKPPWIKLYRDLLDDIEWHNLDAKAAKALVMIWLIASEADGKVPSSKTLAFRLRVSEKEIKSILSQLSHYLEHDDINLISERYQDDALEKERETEKEKEEEREAERKRASRLPPDWKPSHEDWAFAESEGVDVQRELAKFRDYWDAQPYSKAVKVNWSATWRNWCRNAGRKTTPSIAKDQKDDWNMAINQLRERAFGSRPDAGEGEILDGNVVYNAKF